MPDHRPVVIDALRARAPEALPIAAVAAATGLSYPQASGVLARLHRLEPDLGVQRVAHGMYRYVPPGTPAPDLELIVEDPEEVEVVRRFDDGRVLLLIDGRPYEAHELRRTP